MRQYASGGVLGEPPIESWLQSQLESFASGIKFYLRQAQVEGAEAICASIDNVMSKFI